MNLTQLENATITRLELSPLEEVIARMEQLIERRKIWLGIIEDKKKMLSILEEKLSRPEFESSSYRKSLVEQQTAAALKVTDLTAEFFEVAVKFVTEYKDAKLITV